MHESFVLKDNGFDLFEQSIMTAEERRFMMGEIERKQERDKATFKDAGPKENGGHTPGTIPS